MIKFETLGMYSVAKNEPTLTSLTDIQNYSFVTVDGILYLVSQEQSGDKQYAKDYTIKAGEFFKGYVVASLADKKLVIDGKHIAYDDGKGYSDLAKDDILTLNGENKLAVALSAPASGVYFVISDVDVTLTEPAIKAYVKVADNTGTATLAGLTDVDTTGATNGQVLKYDGTKWAPAADATE